MSLSSLAPGVFAWLPSDSGTTHATNAGVVIAEDGVTVVDTAPTPLLAAPLAAALAELTPAPVRRLLLTGSHIDLVGGAEAFPLAAIYGSPQTSAHLDQPPSTDAWKRLHPSVSNEFDELASRPVSHVVAEPAHLCPASIAVPVGGPQFENLCVQVPSAGVVFTGCLASFGTVPLGFEADFATWIATVERLATLGEIFVPAHGDVGGVDELAEFGDYLQACVATNGDVSQLANGPWMQWQNQHFHEINVERAAMLASGDPSPPPSMLRLLGR